MTHINDDMLAVVGPHINDGLAAFFKGDPLDPSDPEITVGYRFTDATLDPVKGPALTFTRAGPALVRDRYNTLIEVPADVPRFPGAIYTRNLILQSEDLDTAPWSALRVTLAADAGTPPTGITNVWKMTETAVLETHSMRGNIQPLRNSLQVRVKPAERTKFSLYGSASVRAEFDLTLGEQIGTNANAEARITPLNDGWFLCEVWALNGLTTTDLQLRMLDDAGQASYLGDGVSGMFVTGAMAELKDQSVLEPSAYVRSLATFGVNVVGPALGVQIEGASENILPDSEDFSAAGWSLVAMNPIGVNAAIAPDGTLSADLIIPDTTSSNSHYIRHGTAAVNIGDGFAYSCYLKAGGYTKPRLRLLNSDAPIVVFDLVNGTATTGGTILNVGNGWWRCTTYGLATTTSLLAYIYPEDGTFAGDGVSGVYAWGSQVEKQFKATSYIKTDAAVASRVGDICKTSDVSWFTQGGPGTVYARASTLDGGNDYLFSINNNTFQSRIAATQGGPGDVNDITAVVVAGGVTDSLPSTGGEFADQSVRLAVAWSDGESVLAAQGSIKSEVSSARPNPTGILTLDIGNRQDEGAPWFGVVSEFAYSNIRRPNDELQRITSP